MNLQPSKPNWPRRIARTILILIVAGLIAIAGCNWWLISEADGKMTRDTNLVAAHETAIVLGTSPGSTSAPNIFFTNRIRTTAALWHAGKLKHIIVSGDNRRKDYDEPTAMLNALVAQGVPAHKITRDYAGFRTLDSMFRAVNAFKVTSAIVVTDDWHLPRALFLAESAGIAAIGVASRDVAWDVAPGTRLRELLSRVKAVLDIYVLNTKPRFSE